MGKEKFLLTLVVLIFDVLSIVPVRPFWARSGSPASINHDLAPLSRRLQPASRLEQQHLDDAHNEFSRLVDSDWHQRGASFVLFAQAKGVAGLGKAGGDGTGGADKAGTQVPPEVYNALTYAGTAFLFTLSVPLILYGLNKLLNKIEDCFGCGPASKKKKIIERQLENQKLCEQNNSKKFNESNLMSRSLYPKPGHHGGGIRSVATDQLQNYHHQQHANNNKQLMNTDQSPQVASFPANKDTHHHLDQHNTTHPGSICSQQNSPAVPVSDSTVNTLAIDLNQQDYSSNDNNSKQYHHRHHQTTTSTTSAFQDNYHQPAPFIISSPHI